VVLADPNVSRNHAEVRPSGDGFEVVDQGSTNGTKVNGVRVAEHQLRPGDEIRLGNTVLRFEAS
jgi:pSer/pThr/pTyr-binding forkhead associated (FHA) protein